MRNLRIFWITFCTLSLATAAWGQGVLFVEGGNVGIGTSTPSFDLHMDIGSGSANMWIEGAESGAIGFVDGDAPTNERIVQFLSSNGTFRIRGLSDALSQSVQGIVLDLGSGHAGVGTSSPAFRLEVEDTSTSGAVMRLENSGGICDLDPNTGGLETSCTSDLRVKSDIHRADTSSILADLLAMNLYDYEVRASGDRRVGFIAQYLQESHPDRVKLADDGTYMARQPGTVELLGAVQELHGIVDQLQERMRELESELKKVRSY